MKKLIGLVAALAVLGAVVASFASAEEVTSQTPPAATEASEPAPPAGTEGSETALIGCGGDVCVYPLPFFEGPVGITECSAPGAHPLGSNKASIQNGCGERAVFARRSGTAVFCKEPLTSNNNSPIFNELFIGAIGSHC
jgi:hypothetical protein